MPDFQTGYVLGYHSCLDLPQSNTLTGGTVTYTYDATGRKLRKVSTIGAGTQTDYVDGLQYDNGYFSFLQTEEGRALYNNTDYTYNYEYNLSDHLDNVRVSFDTKTGTADTTQRDDYLPFGMEVSKYLLSPKNEYLYNKKELQEELGVYDYGARQYDPVIARWTTIDPLAEISRRWSPYNYVENNPIKMTDPDGMAGGRLDSQGERIEDEAAELENKKLIADMKRSEQDMAALAGGSSNADDMHHSSLPTATLTPNEKPGNADEGPGDSKPNANQEGQQKGFPSFAALWENYPCTDAQGNHSFILPQSEYYNQCAIRLGSDLIESGANLNNYKGAVDPATGYPLRATELASWLTGQLGKPMDFTYDDFQVYSETHSMQGIIYEHPYQGSPAHVDLFYNGNNTVFPAMVGEQFYYSGTISYWQIK